MPWKIQHQLIAEGLKIVNNSKWWVPYALNKNQLYQNKITVQSKTQDGLNFVSYLSANGSLTLSNLYETCYKKIRLK